MKSTKLILLLCAGWALLVTTGCEDDEVLAISEGQECLDSIPTDVEATEGAAGWDRAAACAEKVSGYNSQQANIIKCGAYLTGGGLDTARIVEAAKDLSDNEGNDNSEAVYIAALTLNKTNASTGLERSKKAQTACNATGNPGYQYLGSLAATGTALSEAFGGFLDPSNISEADLDTAVNECVNNSAECVQTVASSANTLSSTYCVGDRAEEDVCKDIDTALQGSTTDEIAESLLCLLNGKESEDCVP